MDPGHLHQGTRMENMRWCTSDVHFNNEIAIDVAQTSPWPLYKSYILSTHFIKDLSIIGYYSVINNIYVDKSYDLCTYIFRIN